jgi:hypothetical protein
MGTDDVDTVDMLYFTHHRKTACGPSCAVWGLASANTQGERWPPTGDAGMPQGRFPGLQSGRGGTKMAFVLPIRQPHFRPSTESVTTRNFHRIAKIEFSL